MFLVGLIHRRDDPFHQPPDEFLEEKFYKFYSAVATGRRNEWHGGGKV